MLTPQPWLGVTNPSEISEWIHQSFFQCRGVTVQSSHDSGLIEVSQYTRQSKTDKESTFLQNEI